ncbi:autophagy-related protein 8h-like [Raphanus sativus]|uniref:Autophagy-related protein n=1 Tax=Raphanus sativus TaxID=3726 RepID=A0A6J0P969_RAPSA|nr:autophagy-related protein 8h-like [Raphanus sativus]
MSKISSFCFLVKQSNEAPKEKLKTIFCSVRRKKKTTSVGIIRRKSTMGTVVKSFKEQFSADERLKESRNITAKYPDRVPVIIEKYSNADLPDMEKNKYLVPRDMTIGHFIHMLSDRLHLDPSKSLFVFVQNTLPQTASCMDSLYNTFKEGDGFLYMTYSTEKTFG